MLNKENLIKEFLLRNPQYKSKLNNMELKHILNFAWNKGKAAGVYASIDFESKNIFELYKKYESMGMVRISRNPEKHMGSVKYNMISQNFTAYDEDESNLSWNLPFMLDARGIVIDTDTGKVIARPYPKFFNYGENSMSDWPTNYESILAADKLDGSLVIYSNTDNRDIVASSGSTTSDISVKFRKYFDTKLSAEQRSHLKQLGLKYTLLFEYMDPENRIVINYEGISMKLHGAIVTNDTENDFAGYEVDYATLQEFGEQIGCEVINQVEIKTVEDVNNWLKSHNDDSHEGLVLTFRYSDGRTSKLKFKTEQYVSIHTEVSHINEIFNTFDSKTNSFSKKTNELLINALFEETLDDVLGSAPQWNTEILQFVNKVNEQAAYYNSFLEQMPKVNKDIKETVFKKVATDMDQPTSELIAWATNKNVQEYILSKNKKIIDIANFK